MSGTIHLIVENKTDADVVRAILKAKQIDVRVRYLEPPNAGGISRLAKELEALIKTAKAKRKSNDCIAVLHDADSLSETNRQNHDKIAAIYEKYKSDVVLIIARDELEAWLLADEGLCQWLGEKAKNCDGEKQPSLRLNRAVKKKTKRGYSGSNRDKVLEKLDGSGDKYSPSMEDAMKHLNNAPCVS